jgi:hypothetical protein
LDCADKFAHWFDATHRVVESGVTHRTPNLASREIFLVALNSLCRILAKMRLPQTLKFVCFVFAFIGAAGNSGAQTPTITNQPISRAIWAGGNVMFSVGVSNASSFAYQWQLNNTNLPNGIITTVAGGGTGGGTDGLGDGGAATNASLNDPLGVAVDAIGNLFIADLHNQRIRKVDTNGIITTSVGGGPNNATNVVLSYPSGCCIGLLRNLFIADTDDQVVREVDSNGIITTVAGNYSRGYSGDGKAATNASLSYPEGVALDAFGNLFIADSGNNCIRKVDTNGIITTVAGNGGYGSSGDGTKPQMLILQTPTAWHQTPPAIY